MDTFSSFNITSVFNNTECFIVFIISLSLISYGLGISVQNSHFHLFIPFTGIQDFLSEQLRADQIDLLC